MYLGGKAVEVDSTVVVADTAGKMNDDDDDEDNSIRRRRNRNRGNDDDNEGIQRDESAVDEEVSAGCF